MYWIPKRKIKISKLININNELICIKKRLKKDSIHKIEYQNPNQIKIHNENIAIITNKQNLKFVNHYKIKNSITINKIVMTLAK